MPLITNRLSAADGSFVCEMILQNPAALNALTPDIVRAAQDSLAEYAADDSVAAVVIRGEGERAFCAGGDVRYVRECVCGGKAAEADGYFADEYLLDFSLHCFPKPLVGIGGGVVMGGGMGILQGCDIRAVSPNTKAAMPEGKIGFFPDVGAAFFMQKFRDSPQAGYYLGLTGRMFFARDALQIGAADVLLAADSYSAMLSALRAIRWSDHADAKAAAKDAVLNLHSELSASDKSALPENGDAMERVFRAAQSGGTEAAIAALPEEDRKAAAAVSPLSRAVWTEYYCNRIPQSGGVFAREGEKTERDILREVFAADYTIARNILRCGDFAEGVRALLIDKDNKPEWRAPCDDKAIAALFAPDSETEKFKRRLAEFG